MQISILKCKAYVHMLENINPMEVHDFGQFDSSLECENSLAEKKSVCTHAKVERPITERNKKFKASVYLASKATRTTNSMNVKFSIVWKVIIDHQRNL